MTIPLDSIAVETDGDCLLETLDCAAPEIEYAVADDQDRVPWRQAAGQFLPPFAEPQRHVGGSQP
ncbi:MAG: hypothetical protein ABW137_35025, partial [Mycobacterium sp.]